MVCLDSATVLDIRSFVAHLRETHPVAVRASFELANYLNVLRRLVQEKHFRPKQFVKGFDLKRQTRFVTVNFLMHRTYVLFNQWTPKVVFVLWVCFMAFWIE